jgi:hypothetical protein
MKKYTVLSIALIFGLFLMTDFVKADDHDKDKQKRPIAVNNLPEEVREAVQEDYEGFRITEAFHVTKTEAGAEGTQREGMQQREGAESQRQGTQQGTARTGTQREGVQQREGAERQGTQQGTERTGTQPEGAQQQREGAEGLGGMFSSDDVDSYYELTLAKGQETKTVKYNEDGDELDKEEDKSY